MPQNIVPNTSPQIACDSDRASVPTDKPEVHGVELDAQTRCAHFRSPLDVVAIRMHCCDRYYACKDCHDAMEDHALEQWPAEAHDTPAVLCGVCGTQLTIREYTQSGHTCPHCHAGFNPGCRNHWHFYFATAVDDAR